MVRNIYLNFSNFVKVTGPERFQNLHFCKYIYNYKGKIIYKFPSSDLVKFVMPLMVFNWVVDLIKNDQAFKMILFDSGDIR